MALTELEPRHVMALDVAPDRLGLSESPPIQRQWPTMIPNFGSLITSPGASNILATIEDPTKERRGSLRRVAGTFNPPRTPGTKLYQQAGNGNESQALPILAAQQEVDIKLDVSESYK